MFSRSARGGFTFRAPLKQFVTSELLFAFPAPLSSFPAPSVSTSQLPSSSASGAAVCYGFLSAPGLNKRQTGVKIHPVNQN